MSRPLRSARALLRRGRGKANWRRVADWLGFEGSTALVRTLRRCVIDRGRSWPVELVRSLRAAWRHPRGRKLLLHAASLDREVVELVAQALTLGLVDALHPRLLAGTFNAGQATVVPRHFREAAAGWRALRPDRRFPTLRTAEELDALREELRDDVVRTFLQPRASLPSTFPPPPLTTVPGVQPLASAEDLAHEAAAMDNCLDLEHWATWTRRRQGFAYAVEADGERADVWVTKDMSRPGLFVVQEVRGPSNAPASEACLAVTRRWLEEHARRAGTDPVAALPAAWHGAWTPIATGVLPPELQWADDEIPF